MLIISNETLLLSYYLIDTKNGYVLDKDNIQVTDLALVLDTKDLYFEESTIIISIKFLKSENLKEDTTDLDVQRLLVVTSDTYIYELDIVYKLDSTGNYTYNDTIPAFTFQTYGKGLPRPFISVYQNIFGIAYWDKTLDRTLTSVIYKIPEFPANLSSLKPQEFSSIIGGYQFTKIPESISQPLGGLLIYPQASTEKTNVFIPNPETGKKPALLRINNLDSIVISLTNDKPLG